LASKLEKSTKKYFINLSQVSKTQNFALISKQLKEKQKKFTKRYQENFFQIFTHDPETCWVVTICTYAGLA
jgi:hypothetical protein